MQLTQGGPVDDGVSTSARVLLGPRPLTLRVCRGQAARAPGVCASVQPSPKRGLGPVPSTCPRAGVGQLTSGPGRTTAHVAHCSETPPWPREKKGEVRAKLPRALTRGPGTWSVGVNLLSSLLPFPGLSSARQVPSSGSLYGRVESLPGLVTGGRAISIRLIPRRGGQRVRSVAPERSRLSTSADASGWDQVQNGCMSLRVEIRRGCRLVPPGAVLLALPEAGSTLSLRTPAPWCPPTSCTLLPALVLSNGPRPLSCPCSNLDHRRDFCTPFQVKITRIKKEAKLFHRSYVFKLYGMLHKLSSAKNYSDKLKY